ncbi:MAG TPA: hypothetical protein VNY36_03000 [Bacteroidia bacterium]|jgi:hypothetical protein|nr:hypothetical protein [Bacteroidia bacterium]
MSKKRTVKKHIIKKGAYTGRKVERILFQTREAKFQLMMQPNELTEMIAFSKKAAVVNETAISKNRLDAFQYYADKPVGVKEMLYLTEQEVRLFAASLAYARYHYCDPDFAEYRFKELEAFLGKRQVKSIKNKVGKIEWAKEEIGQNDGWGKEESNQ